MKNTEDKIIEAAMRVLAKEGVSGATTRKIALEAKVNEVTLFRHFKTKDELIRRVGLYCSKRFEHIFNEAPFETKTDLHRMVQTFAINFTRMLRENEDFIRTFFGELTRQPELCQRIFVQSSKPVRTKFIAYIQGARKNGIVRKDIDPTTAVDAFTGMLIIGMIRRPLNDSHYTYEKYIKTCQKLFIKGIEP